MIERLKTAVIKPNKIFMFKNDSIGKSLLFILFVSFLCCITIVSSLALLGSAFLKVFDIEIVEFSSVIIMLMFIIGMISIPITLFFNFLILTAIIFLFSSNKDKTFESFFNVTTYILGASNILSSVIIFLFCAGLVIFDSLSAAVLLYLIMSSLFIGLIIWTIYALLIAYRDAKDY